ncbi:hypothetical protein IAD21_04486 [Abditibacteriota bacterium]|nr:hypothetical protein IAD21_04486 [Abditibacteriota bacterium]
MLSGEIALIIEEGCLMTKRMTVALLGEKSILQDISL